MGASLPHGEASRGSCLTRLSEPRAASGEQQLSALLGRLAACPPAPTFKGVRTFELNPRTDGSTDFTMEERFSGLVLPLMRGSMPDFGPVFEAYASDLKRAAERGTPLIVRPAGDA